MMIVKILLMFFWHCGQGFFSKMVLVTTCDVIVTWNPMLGLITDLRDDRATIPAAALSRVRVLRFVCLHFDHHGFVRPPKNERYERLLLGAWLSFGRTKMPFRSA